VYFLPCTVAPYDVVITGDDTYDIGDQLELNCSSEGGPDLEYSWSRTSDFSNDTTINANTITISNVDIVDGGDYTCTVTNGAGTSNDTITVNGESFTIKLMLSKALCKSVSDSVPLNSVFDYILQIICAICVWLYPSTWCPP